MLTGTKDLLAMCVTKQLLFDWHDGMPGCSVHGMQSLCKHDVWPNTGPSAHCTALQAHE
jgi:hypothetical protein